MSEPTRQVSTREVVAAGIYFISLYFLLTGVLYLWGYWSTFGVNILEFMGVADVVKSTAYPVTSAFVFAAIGMAIGEIVFGKALEPGAGRDTTVGKFLRRFAPYFVVVWVGGVLALLLYGGERKWVVLPILLAFPIYLALKAQGLLASLFPDERLRSFALFVLAALPPFAYGHGRVVADEILSGRRFQYAVSPIDNVPVQADQSPQNRLRFLGHAGDYLFFLDPTSGSRVLARASDTKTLITKDFPSSLTVPKAASSTQPAPPSAASKKEGHPPPATGEQTR